MPSRAAHTKSRHGCLRCKQRRVKCDEGKPCRDCYRRNEFCSLVTDPAYIAGFKNESQIQTPTLSTSAASASPFSSAASPVTPPQQQNDLFALFPPYHRAVPAGTPYIDWAEDLHLMAHWSTVTCMTLFKRPGGTKLFQTTAPEVAVKFPPAMHMMLALAALHLKYLRPAEREKYGTISLRHQHHTTQQFQASITNITKENIIAVFLTSSMLSVVCIANLSLARPEDGEQRPSVDDIVAVFFLTRGIRDILYPIWGWLSDPAIEPLLAPILQSYTLDANERYDLPPELAQRSEQLHKVLLEQYTGYHDASKEACHFALLELEKIFRDVVHLPSEDTNNHNSEWKKRTDLELGVLMKWQTSVSATYVNLMKRGHPAALIILAHWVMLNKHTPNKWFLDGWMTTALALIKEALKEEDRHWLDFPEQYVSYV